MLLTPKQIIESCNPVCYSTIVDHSEITEWLYDSRMATQKNSLFFAIKTAQNDGHKYIESLFEKGIRNFIISDEISSYKHIKANFYQVKDVIAAMQQLAKCHRKKFDIPIIAITGSNGKTIVKEWIDILLSRKYSVVKNPNSFNSQIGVAMSLSLIQQKHQIGIFEAGISMPNEMSSLASIIQPTMGVLTNIGDAHDAYFASHEEKLHEKLKLFAGVKTLIYCSNNLLIRETLTKKQYENIAKITWGKLASDHYQILKQETIDGAVHVYFAQHNDPIKIPFVDNASIENALHTAVVALELGFSIAEINEQFQRLSAVNMRLEIAEAVRNSIVLNDTYSLDKNSLQIALNFLSSQIQLPKKCLIISDFEQNILSEDFYTSLAKLIDEHPISKLITVGEGWAGKAHYFSNIRFFHFATTEQLLHEIDFLDFQSEAILVKGARSFQFERVVQKLKYRKHRTELQVSLSALIHNYNYYKEKLSPNTKIMGMVKAMSYGLGDAELINELCYHHIDYLAVAYVDEGIKLRERNITTPIVVLGAEADGFEPMIQHQLQPEIFNLYYLDAFGKIVNHYSEIENYPIHLKLETGMNRLGFNENELDEVLQLLMQYPKLKVNSVFSHLAAADNEKEDPFTQQQIAIFEKMSAQIASRLSYPIVRHLVNSAGITRFPNAHYEMVRLGLGLYGFSNIQEDQKNLQHPAVLKSIITQLKTIFPGQTIGYDRSFKVEKEMKIAIVPIGYADGYPREFSNGVGVMKVGHTFCPIVGKICMDMCMIDVTNAHARLAQEVIIYDKDIPVDQAAKKIGKIPYELLTSISKRVQRVYVRE